MRQHDDDPVTDEIMDLGNLMADTLNVFLLNRRTSAIRAWEKQRAASEPVDAPLPTTDVQAV